MNSRDVNPFDIMIYMTKWRIRTAFATAFIMFLITITDSEDAAWCFFYHHVPRFFSIVDDLGISDAMTQARAQYCR